jgi:hypothetical protein
MGPLTTYDPVVESRQARSIRYWSLVRNFALRFCVAITLGLILLGAVELYSYHRYRSAGLDTMEPAVKLDLAENGDASEREYWKEFAQANRVVYHQYVLWRRAPYQGKFLSIDQDGVRRTLYTQCDGKTFTIWMFGDSVMWGAGTPDAETIPSLVAQDYQKSGNPVCIVNYAEKGWSNTQEMIELIEQLKHATRKPDIVLFYDGGSEAFAAYQSGRADVHSNFSSFKTFLENWRNTEKAGFAYFRQTNTYRLLEKIAGKMPVDHKPNDQPMVGLNVETLSADVVENYVWNMDVVGLLSKQYGFRPIFAWYPNLAVGHKIPTPYEQKVLRMEYQQFPDLGLLYQGVYKRGSEIKRPNFYYLGNLLDDQEGSLYVGLSHLKGEGNSIVADRLFDIIKQGDSAMRGAVQ